MNQPERLELLQDLAALKSDDDDAVGQDPKWFLPLAAHRRALQAETLVVRGGRGAGKSSLFHFLGHLQKSPKLEVSLGVTLPKELTWVEGYSALLPHPTQDVVGAFGGRAPDALRRAFWFGWLCRCLAVASGVTLPKQCALAGVDPNQTLDFAEASTRDLASLSTWLDDLERTSERVFTVTYDGLDRIGTSSEVRSKMTSSLLATWLSLADRYRRIRPKIFVRDDLFQIALSAFPDASKLEARSTSLEWRAEDLYRVLIKHMANTSEGLQQWICQGQKGIPLSEEDALGWTPPEHMPETGRGSQKNFADHLAGEVMGSGARKGFTYRWIPNKLQDAHGRAVPRSILALIRNAATEARKRGPQASHSRLLHHTELTAALSATSIRRVNELKEEFPVVARLANLRGRTVMLDRNETVEALSKPTSTDDAYEREGEEVLRALIELGVMSERLDHRIDVPDIYRYGFDILRKGGTKRLH